MGCDFQTPAGAAALRNVAVCRSAVSSVAGDLNPGDTRTECTWAGR
jgi:hypothetical protein